jgi:transposase
MAPTLCPTIWPSAISFCSLPTSNPLSLSNKLHKRRNKLHKPSDMRRRLERRVAQSGQQVAELGRVLDETAASDQELQQEHAATLDELAWYKRWAFGRRRERFREGEGQGHLFDLDSPANESEDSAVPHQEAEVEIEIKSHRRRRKKREIDWDKLPQVRHEHDLPEEEKNCSCCGRRMDRISEDVTRELELQPAKLEAHIHVRPKYACRRCKEGVSAAPLPQRPIPGGIAGPGSPGRDWSPR